MRTTVTLDPDVEALIRRSMDRGKKGFKQALNEAVRRGLREGRFEGEAPFEVSARPMGLRTGVDPAQIRDVDDEHEVERFLATTRELERRDR